MNKGVLQRLVLGSFVISPIFIQAKEKPYFVFIMPDDVSWDDFGCYGNNVVKTSHRTSSLSCPEPACMVVHLEEA